MKNSIIIIGVIIITLSGITFTLAQQRPTNIATKNLKKISYAYVYEKYVGSGQPISFSVSGNTTSTNMSNKIKAAKYTEDALDIMGAEGWELVTVLTRDFQGWSEAGIETTYYFMK